MTITVLGLPNAVKNCSVLHFQRILAGMAYVSLGAAAPLTPAQKTALFNAAVAALPACYSQELDNCLNDLTPSVPNCAVIKGGDVADQPAFQKAMDRVPFCPAGLEFTRGQTFMVAAAAGALGLVVGLLLK